MSVGSCEADGDSRENEESVDGRKDEFYLFFYFPVLIQYFMYWVAVKTNLHICTQNMHSAAEQKQYTNLIIALLSFKSMSEV